MLKLLLKRKTILIYTPLVIHWISIFVLTSIPDKSMPDLFAISDKAKHFTAFFVLGFFLSLALFAQDKYIKLKENFVKYTLIIGSVYATFDELHQILIPGRSAEILDWIADFLGLFLGVLLVKSLMKKSNLKLEPKTGTEF